MTRAVVEARRVVFSDPWLYAAHPHAVAAPSGWVAVFNLAPRRPMTMHPPEDPFYRNVVTQSTDEGQTWSPPEVVPDFSMSGTECAGLTLLSDGALLLNQWQFGWLPLGAAKSRADAGDIVWPAQFLAGWLASPEHDVAGWSKIAPERIAPWARRGGRLFISRSEDAGRSFRRGDPVAVEPFAGAYGMRGGIELADGRIMIPFSDVPNYRTIFTLTSSDGGRNWGEPRCIARAAGKDFEEPSLLRLASGRLLMCLRENVGRQLHMTWSDDEGAVWAEPRPIAALGYPGHLLNLPDGRVLLTMGWRHGPEFGIRALVSEDGTNWDDCVELSLVTDLPSKNLGYPVTLPRANGGFSTLYYGEDDTGTTCIFQSDWRLES